MLRRIDAVVPAHDEEELIGDCLDALLVARAVVRRSRPALAVGIVVVLDDCRDGSERVVADRLAAAGASHDVSVVVTGHRSVGAARGAGVEAAVSRSRISPSDGVSAGDGRAAGDRESARGRVSPGGQVLAGDRVSPGAWWIASTDADSRVPEDWFGVHAAAAEAGVEVLLGSVRPDFDEFSERDVRHWLETHPAGHLPGNVHGANLGIRLDRLQELGGFSPVPEHEDVDLVERAAAVGLRIVPTLDGVVATSGRRCGRTPGGYAAFLAEEYPLAEV